MGKWLVFGAIAYFVGTSTGVLSDGRMSDKERMVAGHLQYVKALQHGIKGNRSTMIPEDPNAMTRADEYKFCINQGFYKSVEPETYNDFDSIDFCSWYAAIGKWYR